MFLFPGVFGCLLKKYDQDDEYFGTGATSSEENQLYEFPWVLRLVCSDWNNSIEAYFQQPEINSLANKMLVMQLPGQNNVYSQESAQMLEKFGKLLHYVQLHFHLEDEQTLAECYMVLIAHLSNLLSVKILTVEFNERQNVNILNGNLTQTIEMNRCPTIGNLKFLIAGQFVPSQIIEELVQQNRHMESLEFALDDDAQLPRFNFSISLPNLTELNVTIKLYQDFQQLKCFGKNWKLKKFGGYFRHIITETTIWMEVFQMIRKNWRDTLEELSLCFPRHNDHDEVSPLASTCKQVLDVTLDERLEGMKKLETVEIYSDCAMSLDFLLPSSETLRAICVRQAGLHMYRNRENPIYYSAKQRQIVDFIGKEEELTDSNIWELFPNLQSYESSTSFIDRPENK